MVNNPTVGSNGNSGTTTLNLMTGINYLVLKDTNLPAGMKFYLDFKVPAGNVLGFSSSLN